VFTDVLSILCPFQLDLFSLDSLSWGSVTIELLINNFDKSSRLTTAFTAETYQPASKTFFSFKLLLRSTFLKAAQHFSPGSFSPAEVRFAGIAQDNPCFCTYIIVLKIRSIS